MKLGEYQKLKVNSIVSIGAYLVDDDMNRVLLPKKLVPKGIKVDDTINVFVYKDSKGRLISTTKNVFLTVGSVAKLTVNDINEVGAFLNIGIERDLLLPYSEQTTSLKVGDKVKVYMYIDKSDRLVATMYTSNKDVKASVKNKDIRTYEYIQNSEKVYKTIKYNFKGHLIYTDKSAKPTQIKNDFNMSKTTFKNAVGKLLKDNKIKITEKGIYTY